MEPIDDAVVSSTPSRAAMALFDRDRWQRLHPLLDRALDLPVEQRTPWLADLRATSPDVVDDLIALLAAEADADGRGFLSDGARARPDSIGP